MLAKFEWRLVEFARLWRRTCVGHVPRRRAGRWWGAGYIRLELLRWQPSTSCRLRRSSRWRNSYWRRGYRRLRPRISRSRTERPCRRCLRLSRRGRLCRAAPELILSRLGEGGRLNAWLRTNRCCRRPVLRRLWRCRDDSRRWRCLKRRLASRHGRRSAPETIGFAGLCLCRRRALHRSRCRR